MSRYAKHITKVQKPQPQTVKDRPDQVLNSAGGFVYAVSDFDQLDRFLILGCEGGSYYASEQKMTVKNATVVENLLKSGKGKGVVDRVVAISDAGRAPKNDPALLVMAMCLTNGDTETRKYAAEQLPKVARIGTHLFTIVDYCRELRTNLSRYAREGVANWYNSKTAAQLAYQVCKYQSRAKEGSLPWSHRDVLRQSHVVPVSPAHNVVFNYVVKKGWTDDQFSEFKPTKDNPYNYLFAHESAKRATDAKEIVKLIKEYNLARESIPTQFLNDNKVWEAMLPDMPLTGMLRNLGTMTKNDVLGPLNSNNKVVIEKLSDVEAMKKARVHPISIMVAMKTYAQGRGMKGSSTWTPVQNIVDAMDSAFYKAFDAVKPTGKRILIAVDCSGSMDSAISGFPYMTSREVAAALAIVTANTESNYLLCGFTSTGGSRWGSRHSTGNVNDGIKELSISPKMRLDSVSKVMNELSMHCGCTDCSLPMLYAESKKMKVDAFVVITDNETYDGSMKPDAALRQYRKSSGINDAKLVVVATTATPFSIADQKDKNMLDVVGMDTSTPQIIADFIRGDL